MGVRLIFVPSPKRASLPCLRALLVRGFFALLGGSRLSRLVARFNHSEGYKLFSLMRASLVVKCHSATA